MAEMQVKDRAFLCSVEEFEAQAVSNILSVSQLCLFCVSEGVVSTAECGDAHEGKGEEEEATQTVFRECRKQQVEKGQKTQFSEDLQTLLFGQLYQAALKEYKVKDQKMSIMCLL